MLETSARLLRLLSLLGSRRFWAGAELAERLEVTPRTLRRDVEKLRELGYPVSSSTGLSGGYALSAGAALPPLLLEPNEALAVALGLRHAASSTVSGMEEATVQALAKLEQVLPKRLRRRVAALHASISPLSMGGPHVDASLLTTLAGACRDQELVTFRYEDAQGRVTRRRVEPHGMVHAGSRWYLAAWDRDREAFRTFRLDRVGAIGLTSRPFTRRPIPEGSAAAYVSRSVASSAYECSVRVILHGSYDELAQRVPPLAARLRPAGEERCLLESGGHHLPTIVLHIGRLGVDFEVLEPPELVDELRVLSRRFARAADLSVTKHEST